jgi:sugar lactone lactonase YvrE
MRSNQWFIAVLFTLSTLRLAHAQPSSDAYKITRLVKPSAFHGVHGLAFDTKGTLFAGSVVGEAIYRVDVAHGTASVEVGPPDGMADDLTFLSDGTLVWTSINDGKVRARTGTGPIRVIASGLPGINSLAERKTDHRLFAAQVFGGDGLWELDPTGQQPPRSIISNIGGLNGFDIGSDGMIYGPLWFKHQIVRIHPDSGALTVLSDDFGIPAAANFDSHGTLYVVDAARGELSAFDTRTRTKRVIAKVAAALDNLAIDAHDRIFISNMADNGIQEVDPANGHVRQIMKGSLAVPFAIAAVPQSHGDRVFVADIFAFRDVDGDSGRVHETARVWAAGSPIQYTINVSARGQHVLLVNVGGLVQQYDASTYALLQSWQVPATTSAVEMADGSIVVLDGAGKLQRFLPGTGAPSLTTIPFNAGQYAAMTAAGPDALYVSNLLSGTLYRVAVQDGSSRVVASGLQLPQSLAVATDASIVVAEAGTQRVLLVDPATGATRVAAKDLPMSIPNNSGVPVGVTAGSDGTIYVTSAVENSIYRLRPRDHDDDNSQGEP